MSDFGNVRARVFYRVWRDDIALFVATDGDGRGVKRLVGTKVEFEERELGLPEPEPTLSLSLDAAQELMGSLWEAGIRPAQTKFGEGQARH